MIRARRVASRQVAARFRSFSKRVLLGIALVSVQLLSTGTFAQAPVVVFSDDFESNTIDPGKYVPDAPFFEGGIGDIHATAHDGVMEFVGTTTQQWWSGGTLRVVPTFTATEATPVTVSIDRVAEAGVGSASRSALWLLDETKTLTDEEIDRTMNRLMIELEKKLGAIIRK